MKDGSFDLKGRTIFSYALPPKLEASPCGPGTKNKAYNFETTTS